MATEMELLIYKELPWGDLIYAEKATLQLIGIGSGRTFPGEPGGPRRLMRVSDPRGFCCKVQRAPHIGEGVYSASIRIPGPERPCEKRRKWQHFAPGVRRRELIGYDEYQGSAADLVRAGIVPEGCFPGLPGMNKVSQQMLADGSIVGKTTRAERVAGSTVGVRTVRKASAGEFLVSVEIECSLNDERIKDDDLSEALWTAEMMLLPRPPRIDGPYRQAREKITRQKRAEIKLVWSRPDPLSLAHHPA